MLLGASASSAQTIVDVDDLKLTEGYSRSYETHIGDSIVADGLIGEIGGPQRWDFTTGPTGNRFDYEIVSPAESPAGELFAGANFVERLDRQLEEVTGWTYYRLGPAGRELHGFYDEVANANFPAVVFDQPIVDLPSQMEFLDEWSASGSFPTQLDVAGSTVDMVVTVTINSVVDGFGTVVLPGLGEIEVLRVNELNSQTPIADIGGIPIQLERVYSRTYLWISKDYGIVAQLTSEAGTLIPPPDFPIAGRFIRLVECSAPDPVADLKFDIEIVNDVVVLTWQQLSGVSAYAIYSSGDLQVGNAELLGTTVDTRYLDSPDVERKYYWLVPLEDEP